MVLIADSYGYPVYLMISKGQRNDITYAIPVLKQIHHIEGSQILADKGYDSTEFIDYIYNRGGEPNTLSRKGAKLEHQCDWRLYKERHLIETLFLKFKAYRHPRTKECFPDRHEQSDFLDSSKIQNNKADIEKIKNMLIKIIRDIKDSMPEQQLLPPILEQ